MNIRFDNPTRQLIAADLEVGDVFTLNPGNFPGREYVVLKKHPPTSQVVSQGIFDLDSRHTAAIQGNDEVNCTQRQPEAQEPGEPIALTDVEPGMVVSYYSTFRGRLTPFICLRPLEYSAGDFWSLDDEYNTFFDKDNSTDIRVHAARWEVSPEPQLTVEGLKQGDLFQLSHGLGIKRVMIDPETRLTAYIDCGNEIGIGKVSPSSPVTLLNAPEPALIWAGDFVPGRVYRSQGGKTVFFALRPWSGKSGDFFNLRPARIRQRLDCYYYPDAASLTDVTDRATLVLS
jgi:hypothetical protein